MRVAIRADGGPAIGLGHLRRCGHIAGALREAGGESLLITQGKPPLITQGKPPPPPAGGAPWPVVVLPPDLDPADEPEWVLQAARRHGCDAVLVDHYGWDLPMLATLADGIRLILLDDGQRPVSPAHLVVNGAVHAPDLPYRPGPRQRLLLGPRYLPLAPGYAGLPPRPDPGPVRRVLVSLGGADPAGLTPLALTAVLAATADQVLVQVVVGPYFRPDAPRQLLAAAGRHSGRTELVHAPASLRDLLVAADLAVIAGGGTVYEAAAAGCPAVAVGLAQNQQANLEGMARAGALRVAGWAGDAGLADRLATRVAELARSPGARAAMARAGQALADGRGAGRIAASVLQDEREGIGVGHTPGR